MSKWDNKSSDDNKKSLAVEAIANNFVTLTKLEIFTALAYHALIPTNMARSALPNMAIDYAKSMIERLEREKE